MNKTDKLAQEQFDGDLRKTVDYILHNFDKDQLNEYVYDFNKEQSLIFIDIYTKEAVSLMTPEEINELVIEDYYLSKLGMTEDEVRNAIGNPFVGPLKKQSLQLLAAITLPVCVAILFSDWGIRIEDAMSISGLLTTLIAIPMAKNVLRYFDFRKIAAKYKK